VTLARLALLLPLSTYLLQWGLLTIHRAPLGLSRLSVRGTAVVAFLAFQCVLVALTELLSLGDDLRPGPLAAAWLLVTLACIGTLLWTGGAATAAAWIRDGGLGRVRRAASASSASVRIGVAVLGGIAVVLVVIAWLYLPNNADSLVYHLTRVAHWIQNSSVHHYATHTTTQLELAPLHEFNMLHLHLLADTNRLDGFVQLAAFVVAITGATELARLLGASSEVQVVTALIAATIPSAILEAPSTQNNLFAASIGVGLLVIVLAWEPLGGLVVPAIALGLTAGLTLLSKGTLAPLVGPVVLALAARIALVEARQSSWRVLGRRAAVVVTVGAACALLVAGPFFKRNHDLFGSFAGPATEITVNSAVSERASAANVVRSVAANFRIGDGRDGLDSMTSRFVLDALRPVHRWIGAPTDDPAFSIGGPVDVFEHGDFSELERNEDYGANPWHMLLMAFAGVALIVRWARGDQGARLPVFIGFGLGVGFVAFASTTRWSLYATRYQLPVLMLSAPLIALALAGVHRVVMRAVAVLLVVVSLPLLLDSSTRPLLDRLDPTSDLDPYFAPRPDGDVLPFAAADFVELRDALVATGCTRVGVANAITFEYPLWVGLEHAGWTGELRSIDVRNASGALEQSDFEPCATIRQRFWNPPFEPAEGQVETEFGELTLSVDPVLLDDPAGG
jgi:hypothetical protein